MKRKRPQRSARRVGQVLLVSFGLTVVSFVASTAISESRDAGIVRAAHVIASNAAPSIEHLTNLRTNLRDMEVALDDYTDAEAAGLSGERRAPIDRDRALVHSEWDAYAASPTFARERDQVPLVAAALTELDISVDEIFRRLAANDGVGAERVLNEHVKPDIERIGDRLRDLIDLNAAHAATLGERITAIRRQSRAWAIALDTLSVVFAAIVAFAAASIVKRYAQLMELRVSELEMFAGRVAHDLRSPLASVGLALNLAEKSPEVAPELRGALARGSRTLQRVGQLMDGLLVFARAGAKPPAGARTAVNEVVRGVLEDLGPSAQDKRIELRADVEPSASPVVACSAGVLASLVANLVENALKYMNDAPVRRVTVRVRDAIDPRFVRFEVEDTGPGVPVELRRTIFQPYVRAPDARGPGLGLGLATVRRLAEAHGGSVDVTSADGRGAIFWFELPRG